MSSKMMMRFGGSSIRTLINRHLRLALAAKCVETETRGTIYNRHYLLTNSFVPQTLYFGRGFSNDATGYSVLKEAASGRRKEKFDEYSVNEDEDEDDDDIEMEDSEFDSDDSEFDSDASAFDSE